MAFAKLKTLFRKDDERIIDTSWRRVGTLFDAFSAKDYANYVHQAG